MQGNSAALAKQAVEAALKGSWDLSIQLNTQILELDPDNMDAKARLGRAYLQTKQFSKAKKLYKEILEKDPINSIALKNYKLAKDKTGVATPTELNAKASIKEPGTSTEAPAIITAKRITATSFTPSEELKVKINKKSAQLLRKDTKIAEITLPAVLKALQKAKAKKAVVTATVMGGHEKEIKVVLRTTEPVFKSSKQTVKPYIKKGTIDEPELELETSEEN